MIITNISNAILRNTQNLAKVSIFGGFAYGFIQTMKSGESALVPTSRWVSSHVLSSSQHKGGKEERNSAGEEKAEDTESGVILREVSGGYRAANRILQTAKVIVSKND